MQIEATKTSASTFPQSMQLGLFAHFLAVCPLPIIVTDESDTIFDVNMATMDWLGVSKEALVGSERESLFRIPGFDCAGVKPGSVEAAELHLGLQARVTRQALNEPPRQTTVSITGGPYALMESLYTVWILQPPLRTSEATSDAFGGLQENLLDQLSFAVLLVDSTGKPFFRNRKWVRWIEDVEIDVTMLRELKDDGYVSSGDQGNPLETAATTAIRGAIQSGNYDTWLEFAVPGLGMERWFEANLRPIAWEQEVFFCVEIGDCTQRHAAQTELRTSEQRFRDLAEISSDWFWETDNNLRLTYISDRFYEITGISPDALLGKTRVELVPADVRESAVWETHWNSVLAHQPFRNFQYAMKMANGEDANLSLSAKPIFDESEKFLGYRGVGAEVTHLIEAEKSKRIFDQRIAHAQRVEALGTLAGGIAHDINNALLPILNMVKMVAKRLPEDSQDREMLQTALESANHCKTLVKSILNFSRQQDVTMKACDMTAVLQEAVGMLRSIIPSIINVEAKLPTRPIRMTADDSQIKQLLVNLAKNAADAIGMQPGRITIDCAVIHDESMRQRMPIPVGPGAYFLKLSVSDTGQGMDEATRLRVFEPFFTTKPPGEGTGLGLAIVHSAVKSHDGLIDLESTPGIGTVFTIHLPLGLDPNEAKQN